MVTNTTSSSANRRAMRRVMPAPPCPSTRFRQRRPAIPSRRRGVSTPGRLHHGQGRVSQQARGTRWPVRVRTPRHKPQDLLCRTQPLRKPGEDWHSPCKVKTASTPGQGRLLADDLPAIHVIRALGPGPVVGTTAYATRNLNHEGVEPRYRHDIWSVTEAHLERIDFAHRRDADGGTPARYRRPANIRAASTDDDYLGCIVEGVYVPAVVRPGGRAMCCYPPPRTIDDLVR